MSSTALYIYSARVTPFSLAPNTCAATTRLGLQSSRRLRLHPAADLTLSHLSCHCDSVNGTTALIFGNCRRQDDGRSTTRSSVATKPCEQRVKCLLHAFICIRANYVKTSFLSSAKPFSRTNMHTHLHCCTSSAI